MLEKYVLNLNLNISISILNYGVEIICDLSEIAYGHITQEFN